MKSMQNRKSMEYILKAILIIIAVVPLVYFNQIHNIPLKLFILGTGSWGLGCILKIIAHQLIVTPLQKKNKLVFLTSSINGLLSGIFELGAALAIILLMKDDVVFSYYAIIAFGLAIGSFEILIVVFSKGNELFKGTSLEKSSEKMLAYLNTVNGTKHYYFNLLLPILERVLATFLHISTRGLLFVTIISGKVIPALVALIIFVFADGLIGYYFHISGRLARPKGYVQIHLYLIILTAIATATFFISIAPYKNIAF